MTAHAFSNLHFTLTKVCHVHEGLISGKFKLLTPQLKFAPFTVESHLYDINNSNSKFTSSFFFFYKYKFFVSFVFLNFLLLLGM